MNKPPTGFSRQIERCSTLLVATLAVTLLSLTPRLADANEPLTLEEARQLLREHSLVLQQLDRTIDQTALLEAQARAIVRPTVNLTALYTLHDQEVTLDFPNVYAPLLPYLDSVAGQDPALDQFFSDNPGFPDARALASMPSEPTVVQRRHDVRAVATVTQPVFNARAFPALRMARLAQSQARLAREEVLEELDSALVSLFYQAVRVSQLREILAQNVELTQLLLEERQIEAELGTGAAFEIARAETALLRAEREAEAAERSEALLLEAIRVLLQADAARPVVAPQELPWPRAQTVDSAAAEARSPALAMAEAQRALADESVIEARNQLLPMVFAQAQGMLQRPSALAGDAFTWSLTLQASWDIYQGGLRRTLIQERELDVARALLAETDERAQLRSRIRQLMIEAESAHLQIEIAEEEQQLADLSLALAQEGQRLGAARALDVELARQQKLLADLAVLDARTGLQTVLIELERLEGGLD